MVKQLGFRASIDSNASSASVACMATLTIRDLEPEVRDRLKVRAAKSGRSMEEEVRMILRAAVDNDAESNPVNDLAERIHALFAPLGGLELELPPREPMPEPIKFK